MAEVGAARGDGEEDRVFAAVGSGGEGREKRVLTEKSGEGSDGGGVVWRREVEGERGG